MATTVMASSASKILSAKTALYPPPKHPHRPLPVTCRAGGGKDEGRAPLLRLVLAASPLAAAALAAAAASPLPALAAEMEKAALFDFNLTLPAIAAEFLLLMVALDKTYFTPLGKFMDNRDAEIRAGLAGVKDTSAEVKQLEAQGAAVMKAARAEISAALNQMKREMTVDLEAQLAVGRKRVEAELAEALQSLEKQKEDTIKSLDSQIAALGDEIVKKVLPTA